MFLGGCLAPTPRALPDATSTPTPPALTEPMATHRFIVADGESVVGEPQLTHIAADETLSGVARRFNLGYEEIVRANPGVDPWLPGADREIVLPTQFVLPDAPHEGLVINVATMRAFYYPKPKPGEPQTVITHPIGIGKIGWSTPEGETKVVSKRKNPIWTPPVSVRKEHRENGDPLPRQVQPGPDNPLGAFAMNLGWAGYLIHGTNKPYGVGMRSSHGCLRFYPEDIVLLFQEIPVGARVRVVNQPVSIGWRQGALYMQAAPPMADDARAESDAGAGLDEALVNRLWQEAKPRSVAVDLAAVSALLHARRGVAAPVSMRGLTVEQYLAKAPRVHNRLPKGATWDGKEELLVTAEEYEAARAGKTPPKTIAGKSKT